MTKTPHDYRPTADGHIRDGDIAEFVCICGHDGAEHEYHSITGNWVCGTTDCDCQGFEAENDDEWDGDENRE